MRAIAKFARPWMGLWMLVAVAACATEPTMPPTANVTEIETTTRAAKDPNCYMPVIYAEPTVDYRKIAIVDAWASLQYSQQQVLEEVKRKACETGADAVLVLSGNQQVTRRQLYEGEPNPTRLAYGADAPPGDYIMDRERQPDIGGVGHRGTYVDAVAIVYTDSSSKH
ncbi:MAG TPA: hypothetical protein VGY99_19625 [Candidatus Binataceae bacterium]|nr:hypothetical protein [Candidatus Binataceae bacterium]